MQMLAKFFVFGTLAIAIGMFLVLFILMVMHDPFFTVIASIGVAWLVFFVYCVYWLDTHHPYG